MQRGRVHTTLLAAWLATVVGCGKDPESTAPESSRGPSQPDGHVRMLALLRDLDARRQDDNIFVGDRAVREARAEIAAKGAQARWQTHQELGYALVRLGSERDGIEVLDRALAAVVERSLTGGADAELALHFHLGVAWLRLGETENCCHQRTVDSCILPLRGGALHGKTEGSTKAAAHFRFVLDRTAPNDYWHLANLWLLNLAAMTLGTWPESVPEQYRLPESAFRSREDFPKFDNVGAQLGLDVQGLAGGMVVEDFDGDERLDVMMSDWNTSGQLRLFVRRADGAFVDRSMESGLGGLCGGLNLVTADYDSDGDVDVLVLRGAWLLEHGRYPNSLVRNNGDGTFTDVTFESGLGAEHWPTQTAAFADYDLDGDLDLYIGNESSTKIRCASQLFRNDGNVRFTEVGKAAGVENFAYAKGVSFGDIDGDRYPDLYVSNLDGSNRLYHNRGDGTFVDIAAARGVTGPDASFPCWFWDFDNDGALDLWVSAYGTGIGHIAAHHAGIDLPHEINRLYRGDGHGGFEDVAAARGLTYPAMPMGSNFGDIDGDGWLDCYLGTGDPHIYSLMPNLLFLNRGGMSFADVSMASGTGHLQKGHGVALADFDHDGDLDLFARIGGAYLGDAFVSTVFENPGFGNRFVTIRLVGRDTNRSALGSRLRIVVADANGERTIHRVVGTGGSFGANPLRQTIGLGKATRVVRIEVEWQRSGRVQQFAAAELDCAYEIVEGGELTRSRLVEAPIQRR